MSLRGVDEVVKSKLPTGSTMATSLQVAPLLVVDGAFRLNKYRKHRDGHYGHTPGLAARLLGKQVCTLDWLVKNNNGQTFKDKPITHPKP